MSRKVVFVLVALAIAGLAYLRFKKREDIAFTWAKEDGTITSLREYLDRHPDGASRDDARRLMRQHYDAALERYQRAATAAPEEQRAFVTALLGAHREQLEPRVAVELSPVDADSLAATDALLAAASTPDRPIAPIEKHFAGDLHSFSWALASALDDQAKALLGIDALTFEDKADVAAPPSVLAIGWAVRATDRLFGAPNQGRMYAGIAVDFQLTWTVPGRAPLSMTVPVELDEELSFESNPIASFNAFDDPSSDMQDDDVYRGMVGNAFERLGKRLFAHLGGTAAPAQPATPDLARVQRWCEEHRDDRACFELAQALIAGDGVPADKARAAELLLQACLGRAPDACVVLAQMQLRGDGVERDPYAAAGRLEHGCGSWHAESCLLYGEMLVHGAAVADLLDGYDERIRGERGLAMFVKACDCRLAAGCIRAAGLWQDGTAVAKDGLLAAIMLRRACGLGEPAACERLARLPKSAEKRPHRVLGMTLPTSATVYDARFATLYQGSADVAIWVASPEPRSVLYDFVLRQPKAISERITVVGYDLDDDRRPRTLEPPSGTTAVFRFGSSSKYAPCPDCAPGARPPLMCDCPPE